MIFGKPGYASRQAEAIDKHLSQLTEGLEDLQTLFECWVENSEKLEITFGPIATNPFRPRVSYSTSCQLPRFRRSCAT